mmetsp:Transcript_52233/g.144625  ORF Transcript_52233/g.144625 Transcript_52233/m.144625 type:complete len:200 (+) Transcript_52233:142-741(+)
MMPLPLRPPWLPGPQRPRRCLRRRLVLCAGDCRRLGPCRWVRRARGALASGTMHCFQQLVALSSLPASPKAQCHALSGTTPSGCTGDTAARGPQRGRTAIGGQRRRGGTASQDAAARTRATKARSGTSRTAGAGQASARRAPSPQRSCASPRRLRRPRLCRGHRLPAVAPPKGRRSGANPRARLPRRLTSGYRSRRCRR